MNHWATLLQAYPQLGTRVEPELAALHQGFSGARVWSVQTTTGRYAVRWWPSGWSLARLSGLHQLLRSLHQAGLSYIAVPLPNQRGETLMQWGDQYVQVEPWLPGETDRAPGASRRAAAMEALARWHQAAAQYRPLSPHQAWFAVRPPQPAPAVLERRQRLRQLQAEHLRRAAEQAVHRAGPEARALIERMTTRILQQAEPVLKELDIAASWTVSVQPVLRDIWREHVLFTGDAVSGLIDPSACRTDTVAADLSRLLGSWWGRDISAWTEALAQYQKHRSLTAAERNLIPILHHSGVLLSGVTWLEWLGPEQRFSPNDPRVLRRLQDILEGWESSPRLRSDFLG